MSEIPKWQFDRGFMPRLENALYALDRFLSGKFIYFFSAGAFGYFVWQVMR